MTITFTNSIYQSTEHYEAWIYSKRVNAWRLVDIKIPGWQYVEAINEQLKSRGFKIELR